MGTFLVRHFLAHARPVRLGHSVFIAPPSQGSELADQPKWLFEAVIGINLRALGKSEKAFWRKLPARVDYPLGIIAGTGRWNPFGRNLPGAHDGTVTLESTRIDGSADSIELPWAHTAMLFHRRTAGQVLHFLQHGRFDQDEPGASASGR
jgi:hypothetical protein